MRRFAARQRLMALTFTVYLLCLVGFVLSLGLGLYVLSRRNRRRAATLIGATALAVACWFLFNALASIYVVHDTLSTSLNRAAWWTALAPAAILVHLSIELDPHAAAARWSRPVIWTTYGGAVLLALLVLSTDTMLGYNYIRFFRPIYSVTPGPHFVVYLAYLCATGGFAVANLGLMWARCRTATAHWGAPQMYRAAVHAVWPGMAKPPSTGSDPSALAFGPLTIATLCISCGNVYLAANFSNGLPQSQTPGYSLTLAGVLMLAVGVAENGDALWASNARRDVAYRAGSLTLLLAPYAVVFAILVGLDTTKQRLFALFFAGLITAAYMLHDTVNGWLDAVFFSPTVRQERATARAYTESLAAPPASPQPNFASRKHFDDAVRRALTDLSDPTRLVTTPLLNLTIVTHGVAEQQLEDNSLNRVTVLKEILLELLDGLRPRGNDNAVAGEPWRFYNCLYYPYVRGINRRQAPAVLRGLVERRRSQGGARTELEQILQWLTQVDDSTFYKWQRRGSDAIAAALLERNTAVGGTTLAAALAGPISLEAIAE